MLLQRLEEDDEECTRRYKEINDKWSSILVSKDPLGIHAEMEGQSAKCLEIMVRKDAVIAELRQELENADLQFIDDQKIQNEDIDLLIDRMDKQVIYTSIYNILQLAILILFLFLGLIFLLLSILILFRSIL